MDGEAVCKEVGEWPPTYTHSATVEDFDPAGGVESTELEAVEVTKAVTRSDSPSKQDALNSNHYDESAESGKQSRQFGSKDDADKKSDDGKEESKEKVSILRLFKYATPFEVFLMFLGLFMAAVHGTAVSAVMIVFGNSVQSLINATASNIMSNGSTPQVFLDGLASELKDQSIIYAGMAAGVWLASYLQVLCWYTVGESVIRRIRRKFFHAVLHKDIGWFDTHKTGELASRLSDDILKIYNGIGDKNSVLVQWLACSVSGFIIGFVYSWRLSLVVLATTPLIGVSSAFLSKIVTSYGTQEQDAYAKAGGVAEEVLSSIRTVVAFGGEEKEAERYSNALEGARKVGVKKGVFFGLGFGVVYFLMFGAFALAFWYGSVLIWDGTITAGDLLTSFFAILTASFAIGSASPSILASSVARGAAVTVYKIIDEEPVINSASHEGETLDSVEGNIFFEDIQFNYPARPDVKVLNGLSLPIKTGTTVALVGPSGCGKSTCVQLLQRFYDPECGRVTLDGHDIRILNVKWLRSQIGVVSQEPVLFEETIANNIAFGHFQEVSRGEIIAAAKMSNAHDFIMEFPDGYDTQVGERGAQMSGGQKQRIAIARALIRNPKILLLDEATSALDTESERIVQAALDKAREGRTTIVIAHRLTTIQNADCIVAIESGRVAEKGSHSELMQEKGLYYALVSMQNAIAEAEQGNVQSAELMLQTVSSAVSSPTALQLLKQNSVSPSMKLDENPSQRQASMSPTERQKSIMSSSKTDTDEEDEGEVPKVSALRLFGYNKPEFPIMALGTISALCFGVLFPLFGIVFSRILNIFRFVGDPSQEDNYKSEASFWSGMFALMGLGTLILIALEHFSFSYSGEALTKRMRSLAFRAVLRKNIAFFDEKKNSTGALATQLSTDAALMQGATGARIGYVIQFIGNLGGALVISFIASWQLTLVLLGMVPLTIIGAAIQTTALAGFSAANRPELILAGKHAIEHVDSIRTVVSLGLEDRAVERYMNILEPLRLATRSKRHVIGLSFGFGEATFFFLYAVTFSFGGYLIANHGTAFIDVFEVFGAMLFAALSMGEAASFAPDLSKATRAAARILTLIDTPPEIDSRSDEGDRLDNVVGDISLRNVRFRYPTRPDVDVLQDTTIMADHGQTVALVGQSGCGKSTSVSLLERFYDPVMGTVNLDGQDIRTMNLSWLRRQMGLVQQEPILFNASIADNIAYGALDRNVSLAEVQEVAKKANIHNFIVTLPEGYDTNVGAKGTQLSGGQKQRVAIARALIRNPKILLLDEATSALDTESEKVVQEALDVARQGRTSIVIAHRLSTIQNADKIVVLGSGQVLEQGNHLELMALEGAYYKLNCAQEGNEGATLA